MIIKQLRENPDYLVLKQWCLTICDYLLSINSDYSEIVNGEYGFLSILKEIDKTHNLRKMKDLYKETLILIGEDMLSPEQMAGLNQLLKEKFGNNLAEEKNEELVKIQKIVNQGKIRNDKEFELIKRREEEIWQNNSQIDCSETLRRLMGDYLEGKTHRGVFILKTI